MDGIHDVGGMDGFGDLPPDEPDDASPFHHDWEGRVQALNVAGLAADAYNMDEFRDALEQHEPTFYLETPYYERWLTAVESLLLDADVVDEDELEARIEAFEAGDADVPAADEPTFEELSEGVADAYDSEVDADVDPSFEVGDDVYVKKDHPDHHTRCPRYVRGVTGTVEEYRGTHVYPDDSARGEERGEPLYHVRFDAAEVWGEEYTDADAVRIELWEPYLTEP